MSEQCEACGSPEGPFGPFRFYDGSWWLHACNTCRSRETLSPEARARLVTALLDEARKMGICEAIVKVEITVKPGERELKVRPGW